MISRISNNLALFFANYNVYSREEIPIYRYGFELLISTVLNALGILIISIFTGHVFGGVLYSLAFIPLRVTAGGFHAKYHWSCFLVINSTYLIFAIFQRFISTHLILPISISMALLSLVVVLVISPVAPPNKPLSPEKRRSSRKRSIIISILNILIVMLLFYAPNGNQKFSLFYISGAFVASMLLILAKNKSK